MEHRVDVACIDARLEAIIAICEGVDSLERRIAVSQGNRGSHGVHRDPNQETKTDGAI
jgi:hypothetical protein